MNGARDGISDGLCRESARTAAGNVGKEMGDSVPDVVDDGTHIVTGLFKMVLPVRDGFMDVQDRLVRSITHLIEERRLPVEFSLDEGLVVVPHRNGQGRPLDQIPGQSSWNVAGGIGPFFQEASQDHRMDVLRRRLNAGGSNQLPSLYVDP